MKKIASRMFLLFLLAIAEIRLGGELYTESRLGRLSEDILASPGFRRQDIGEGLIDWMCTGETDSLSAGEAVGLYLLETDFGEEKIEFETLPERKRRWKKDPFWDRYISACKSIWDSAEYFPVAEMNHPAHGKISFTDSWMGERSYGGERRHEGVDLFPARNKRDCYPIVSMTDGVVENMGWLELGGYRIGIRTPGGAVFYYAHLSSYADLEEGDFVKAGDFLGYMGDTGYGKEEGTSGKFPVHLHLGIYLYENGEEISVNPYYVLKYILAQGNKTVSGLSCSP